MSVIVNDAGAHVGRKMDQQGDAHHFRENGERMAAAAQFAGRVAMVGRHNDDAAFVESTSLEKLEESSQTFVRLIDLIGNPVTETRTQTPVVAIHHGQIVTGKLVDVLGLRIKEYRPFLRQSAVEQPLGLTYGGTDLQLVPKLLVGIEFHQVVIRGQQLPQNLIVANRHLVAVRRGQFFQAVNPAERLQIMRMQQHGAGPDRRLRKRGAGILRVDIVDYHTIGRESIEVGREINLRVVGPDVVLPQRINYKNKNVRPPTVRRNQPI